MILPPTHIAILGVAGSGKEILASKLSKYYDIKVLPRRAKNMMLDIINLNKNQSWIMIDFPTNREEAEEISKVTKIHRVIYLDIPLELSVRRQHSRLVHKESGRVYYDDGFFPPDYGRDFATLKPLAKAAVGSNKDMATKYIVEGVTVKPVLNYYARKNRLQLVQNATFDQIWVKAADFIGARGKAYAVASSFGKEEEFSDSVERDRPKLDSIPKEAFPKDSDKVFDSYKIATANHGSVKKYVDYLISRIPGEDLRSNL